ncbi:MAG: MFS transporter, partial [Jannaschia sp.]
IAERFGWHASYVALGLVVLAGLIGFLRLPSSAEAAPDRGRPGLSATLGAARIAGVPALLVTQFLFMTAFYGTYAFFGDHLRATLGMSAGAVGLVVLAYGVGFGIASVGDRVVDRVGPARALPFALGFVMMAYATMPLTTAVQAGAYAAAFVWGFANHFVLGVIVMRLGKLGVSERGSVLGLNTTVTYLGALVGPLVLGLIYASAGFGGLALGAAGCVVFALVATVVGARSRARVRPA